MTAFVPAEVFPPGAVVQEELEARGWTQADLAEIMARPLQVVNEIINAKKRVTEETAKELEAALGVDADFWLKLEATYRLHNAEPAATAISRRAALRNRVPLRYMLRRNWIASSNDDGTLEERVKVFLGVKSLDQRANLPMAAKQTTYGEQPTTTQEVWLLRVRQMARIVPVARFSAASLEATVEKFLTLLRSPDEVRYVPGLLAQAGVRFVVVEQLPGLKTDAVCTWLSENEPVIGMSLMRDRIDNFWFGLRHECDHVLNGDGREVAILDDFDVMKTELPESEQRANEVAADFCVPQHLLADFMARKGPVYLDSDIRNFAHLHGRHSGLVAGQLRRRLGYDKYTSHLARIRHVIISTAVTDGFGVTPEIR